MLDYKLLSLNEIAQTHFNWVESCGWHNKTVLEALALIASEVGESFQELLNKNTSEKFATELCDITLRVIDLCVLLSFDIDKIYTDIVTSMPVSEFENFSNSDLLGLICVHLSKAVNIARKNPNQSDFGFELVTVVALCKYICVKNFNNFEELLAQKMLLNAKNGTRGRKI